MAAALANRFLAVAGVKTVIVAVEYVSASL
jgi:hypothetical protein